ncbi:AMP-binding protein [Streptomyces fimicarius]|uniref:AMP-binding protein n=1 Tax=Streptomyces griseus TaxID=1911 RepID=UPI0033D42950
MQEQPDSTALVHAGHQVTYADLERLTRRATADLDGGTTALSFSPLNFDLALLDVWTVLEAGGTVVVADAGASGDAGYLRDLAQRYEVTLVQGVPPPPPPGYEASFAVPASVHVAVTVHEEIPEPMPEPVRA